jgi:hypothetical protein
VPTKKAQRREVEKRRKKNHIINVLWKLADRGIYEASAKQIADESDYNRTGSFIEYLNTLCDEGVLRMEVYPYRPNGLCTHRYTYMLPENVQRKQKQKKQRSAAAASATV